MSLPMAQNTAPGLTVRSVNARMRIVARGMPIFLAAMVGYELYAVVDHVLFQQFFRQYHRHSLAIGLAVAIAVSTALLVATYLRLYITIHRDPGVTPLGPEAVQDYNEKHRDRQTRYDRHRERRQSRQSLPSRQNGVAGVEARTTSRSGRRAESRSGTAGSHGTYDLEAGLPQGRPFDSRGSVVGPRLGVDNASLELFFSKDVFECTMDGLPNWCNACRAWKQDRTHHCSEVNRCVRKMDHFCPWIGGIVSETSECSCGATPLPFNGHTDSEAFKFFLQFNLYATILCGFAIGICGYGLAQRHSRGGGTDVRTIVALALAAFFGLFAAAMLFTCTNFALANLTSVEAHQIRERSRMMAVRIRHGFQAVPGRYNVVTFPLPEAGGGPADATGVGAEISDAETDPFRAARAARAIRRAARDELSGLSNSRTFAIVPLKHGMNVWNLGWRRNWVSVMGTSPLDWLLPWHNSPCCDSESSQSFYPLGRAFWDLCAEYQLPLSTEREQVK